MRPGQSPGRLPRRMRDGDHPVTRPFPAIAALAALLLSPPAQAEQIDLSTMTCKRFVESEKDEIKVILTWLDAYYKGEDDPPVIDTDKLTSNARRLGEYCASNPTIGLITATDKLFGS